MGSPLRLLLLSTLLLAGAVSAGESSQLSVDGSVGNLPVARVAVLKYGTASWELELMRREGMDAAHGFQLEIVERVSPNASLVALQGGAADFTVSDWIWAARQREAGRAYHYYPYSTAVGELLVPPGSQVRQLSELRGATLGVAGGAEDKSWLLFQAYGKRFEALDLARDTQPRYGAPPLLSGLADSGRLDALLTYWHYAARLKAEGFRPVMSLREVLAELGVGGHVPMLGWVFSADLARDAPQLVDGFLRASYAAKARLLESDSAWDSIRPLMNADDDRVFAELRSAYRQGIPRGFGVSEISAINRVAALVGVTVDGGTRLPALPAEVFWQGLERTSGL